MPTPSQSSPRGIGGYTSGGNAASTSFSSTPTVGRVILVRGEWSPSYGSVPTGVTITDNQGNTYSSQLANNATPGSGVQDAGVFLGWCVANTSSGTFTVTATLTGSGVDSAVSVQAFELPITGITLDQTGLQTVVFGAGNTQTVTASGANSGANRFVVALLGGRNNASITSVANSPPSTGYTTLFDSRTIVTDGVAALGAWKDVTSSETSSVNWGDVEGGGFFSTLFIATFATTGGGGGAVTGTLSATESGPDTIASSGAARVQGSLSVSETGSDTSAISGAVRVSGSLSAAESGSDTAAIAGSVRVAGSLAVSESGADTAALAGAVLVQGALSASESGSDASAISGAVVVQGSLSATESGADTFDAVGSIGGGIVGSLNATEQGSDTFAASGSVVVAGSLSADETGADSAAIVGAVPVQGSLSVSETGEDTFSAQGVATAVTGDLNAQESGSDVALFLGDGVNPSATGSLGFEIVDLESRSWWKRKPKALPIEQAQRKVRRVAKAIDQIATQKAEQDQPIRQSDVRAEIAPLLAEMPGFDWRPLYRAIVEFRQVEVARLQAIAEIERIRAIELDDDDVIALLLSF